LADWAQRFTVREKARADVVTEADVAAQDVIVTTIGRRFPDHNFLGEENLSRLNDASPYCWIIDPLDGTSNYVHHFPFYCVSIGLSRGRELIVGAVYDPNRDEMSTALRGAGARLNGNRIEPTQVASLAESLVVASLPVGTMPDDPAVMRFLQVLPNVQSVQRTGSAALNLAYIASGRLEAFWSSSLKPWDVAAGAVIVEEAGGRVSKMDGTPFDLQIPNVLASNGTGIHEELQPLLHVKTGDNRETGHR
jgi:myo-inositol-1(or 4)-monophosphatase